MEQPAGVYQQGEVWTWRCPKCGAIPPGSLRSRAAARTDYLAHKQVHDVISPSPAQPPQPERSPEDKILDEVVERAKAKAAPKKATKKGRKRKQGVVARVWEICNKMKDARRKDVLAACEEEGINPYTAATQYQLWKHRNDKEAAA